MRYNKKKRAHLFKRELQTLNKNKNVKTTLIKDKNYGYLLVDIRGFPRMHNNVTF